MSFIQPRINQTLHFEGQVQIILFESESTFAVNKNVCLKKAVKIFTVKFIVEHLNTHK